MGDPISPEVIERFVKAAEEELQKEAVFKTLSKVPGWLGRVAKGERRGAIEATKRVLSPVRGIKKGLIDLTPARAMKRMTPKERASYLQGWIFRKGEHLHGQKGLQRLKLTDIARGKAGKGSRAKLMAEELSRRGWTGGGRYSKYMPIGGKPGVLGWSALAIPEFRAAMQQERAGGPTPTGEGGLGEVGLGELGSIGGMVMGAGTGGFIPALALWHYGHKAGRGLGRIVDRLRGGADLPTAVSAPSPTEAVGQLSNIQRYYG